jgi:hypothetical protein
VIRFDSNLIIRNDPNIVTPFRSTEQQTASRGGQADIAVSRIRSTGRLFS